MIARHIRWAFLCVALAAGVASLVAGCQAAVDPPKSAPGLAWPPPANAARHTSDDQPVLLGRDYDSKSATAQEDGDALALTGGAALPFALYSLGGFSELQPLLGATVTSSLTPTTPGDGTMLFVGFADYTQGAWEWHEVERAESSFEPNATDVYHSAGGVVHIAVVLAGPGSARFEEISLMRGGDLQAPTNLTATADVGAIHLTWDPALGATGYHIYRALDPPFSSPIQLTTEPAPTTEYTDSAVGQDRIYYYRVTATRDVEESPPSGTVDIYSPQEDLPAPGNPQVLEVKQEELTVSWEWDDAEPSGGFTLFLKTEADFNLDEPITTKNIPSLGLRQTTFQDLLPGQVYFWRIAARTSNARLGRMTDDLAGTTGEYWQWGPPETIGAGDSPLAVVEAEGDLTAAYANAGQAYVSRRTDGAWSGESTGLTVDTYLDIAYGDGQYLVVANRGHRNVYCVVGAPGADWTESLVMTGQKPTLGDGTAGLSCKAAGNSDEFAIVHVDGIAERLYLNTRAHGESSWTSTVLRNGMYDPAHASLAFFEGDLYVLVMDLVNHQLLFGSRSGGYALTDIANSGEDNLGLYNGLTRVGESWITPAQDATNKDLYIISGDGENWTSTLVIGGSEKYGYGARLGALGTGLIVIYYTLAPDAWYLAYFDGSEWSTQPMIVAGGEPDLSGDLAILDDEPYFLFKDTGDGMIKAAKGTPPA